MFISQSYNVLSLNVNTSTELIKLYLQILKASENIEAVAMEQNSFPMNGGIGKNSYSKNSNIQKEGSMIVKELITEAISVNLDIETISIQSNTFRVADMGCSVGPNTFICMKNIIQSVTKSYESRPQKLPEFQVFFNDHSNNDFNTLFTSLPQNRKYLAAGVPGSFYERLFPENSLQIVHSSFALHWLSQIPKEILDKDSPAWNKGKILYTSSSDEVANAYASQFAKDVHNFLNLRAKEMVEGGIMILVMLGNLDLVHRSQSTAGLLFDCLGSCLVDMANEGLISEDQVDAINLPIYYATEKEIADVVEENSCFSLEKMLSANLLMNIEEPLDIPKHVKEFRAITEGIFAQEFKSYDIMGEIFNRFEKKAAKYADLPATNKKGGLLFVALKCKPN